MGMYDGYDRGCCGVRTALLIVASLLTLAIGLILGAVFSEVILGALATVIAFAVVMAVLFVIFLIVSICRRCSCACTE